MALPDFEGWAIFAAVARAGSFTGAARDLGVSKATVSKAISRLEAARGVSLLNRTSRRLSLTETGKRLASHADALVAQGDALSEAALADGTEATGLVRLSAPMSFGIAFLGPVIADFMAAQPGIAVDVQLDDARVDLIAQGFDLAVRIANLPDSSLRTRRVAPIPIVLVAAPEWIARHGIPTHPGDIDGAACFAYTSAPGRQSWRMERGQETVTIAPEGRLRTNNGAMMIDALEAGLGLAFLPAFIVRDRIAAGALAALLPDWRAPGIDLQLVMPPSPLRPRRVALLIDHLAARLTAICADR